MRMKCTIVIVMAIVLLSGTQGAADEDSKPGLGMWVWPQTAFDTAVAREKLLTFCAKEGITHFDQHISIEKGSSDPSVENADALAMLVVAARKQGVTVNALRGSGDMFFADNHEQTLRELRALIAFDKRLPAEARLSGVKYDVEPYSTEEWKAGGESQKKVILDYLSFLRQAKALLKEEAPHLKLCVDVPFWWDKREFAVRFGGHEKLFIQHIQDQTDYIGIMSYRPNWQAVLECVERELAYAEEIGKAICPGLETGEIKGEESWISFWNQPQSAFRQTVSQLQEKLSGNQSVRCIMLHHYSSLVVYLGDTASKPDLGDGP